MQTWASIHIGTVPMNGQHNQLDEMETKGQLMHNTVSGHVTQQCNIILKFIVR